MGLKSYKNLLAQKMSNEDYQQYGNFKEFIQSGFKDEDLKPMYTLHAKYFNHDYNEPCGCGGVKKIETINRWIQDLDKIYSNGLET